MTGTLIRLCAPGALTAALMLGGGSTAANAQWYGWGSTPYYSPYGYCRRLSWRLRGLFD